jgi:hypothetical protein
MRKLPVLLPTSALGATVSMAAFEATDWLWELPLSVGMVVWIFTLGRQTCAGSKDDAAIKSKTTS